MISRMFKEIMTVVREIRDELKTIRKTSSRGRLMSKLIPCREPTPSMPRGPREIKDKRIFESNEFFGFDTETTRCELKELRSYQAEWVHKRSIRSCILYLDSWYNLYNGYSV